MANSIKDNSLSSAESCSLYYFPEIPSSKGKGCDSVSNQGHFVKGALDQNDNRDSVNAQPQDSEQVQQLIEAAFNKGMEQGRTEVIATQQEHVDQATVALKEAMDKIARIRQRDVDQMETETVRLALAIAKKIIGCETTQGSVITHVVQTAMQKVADPRQLTLRLNPNDIDTIQAFKGELLMDDDLGTLFRLEADETIQQGGCIVETNLGDVDARIDQQIKVIEERLTAQLPKLPAKG